MLRSVLLQKSIIPCRFLASAALNGTAFRCDETLVVRSPYADIPPIPNASLTEVILKKSKSFSGLNTSSPNPGV
jgi:hypothetical protein